MQNLYTLKEWATFSGASYWYWWKLAKAGKLPVIRTAGKILVRRSTIEEWMAAQEAASLHTDPEIIIAGEMRRID